MRVALVTGAAGAGIGSATARRLAREGMALVITDSHERRTQETAQALRESGATVVGFTMDVTNRAAIAEVVAAASQQLGVIDVVVNNAAINVLSAVDVMNPSDWDRVVAVNLTGPWNVTRAVLPGMTKLGRGCIVNVASVAGYSPAPSGAAYAASKAALMSLTRSMASEMGRFGIRCNAVAPGIVESRFLDQQRAALMPELERTPLGRFAAPDEIANAIHFLISDGSSFITGETMAVSGGWYMRA